MNETSSILQITYGIVYVIGHSVFGQGNNYSNKFMLHFLVALWNNLWNNLAFNSALSADFQ